MLLTESQWSAQREVLLEGLEGQKQALVGKMLDCQRKFMVETAGATSTNAGAIADFQKIVAPMIRRAVPGTISTDLVGFQPLAGPVGLVYSMRFAFAEAADATGATVVADNDIAAGDEVFANNSKMKRFYSSANVGTTGYPPALTATTSDGLGSTTADYEGFGGRSMRLSILKQTVTAKSRKLQARWTPEAQQDMSAQHGVDLENEITAVLSTQIAHEIDNEILTDLLGLAGTVATFDFAAPPAGLTPNYLGDRYANLGVLITKMAQEIGAKTRIAPGNWLVGSHLITSMLSTASKSVFAPAVQGSFSDPTGNKMVGVLNGSMKVYSYNWGLNDAFAFGGASTATGATGEDILIGLKSGVTEYGAGYFYCPYVPLVATGVIHDANTFMPAISLSTRYGKAMFTSSATSLGNSADFYSRILVKNVAFS